MPLSTVFLLVSSTSPPTMYSSRIKYAFSKLKMMSSSHTLPKYLSSSSTKRWIISSVMSSLSSWSTATQKKRLAYRLYTILYSFHSRKLHILGFRERMVVVSSRMIFFLSFWGSAWYHFCRRTLPCRLNSSTY
eukprot:Opistho-1_new@75530